MDYAKNGSLIVKIIINTENAYYSCYLGIVKMFYWSVLTG